MIFNNITMPKDITPSGDHLDFYPATDAFIPDDGPRHGEDVDYELTKATGPEAERTGDPALESAIALMLELGLTRQVIQDMLTGEVPLIGNAPNSAEGAGFDYIKPPENNDLRKFLKRLSEEEAATNTLMGNGPNF